MKSICSVFLISMFSICTLADANISVAGVRADKVTIAKSKGFQVGVVYSNLSNILLDGSTNFKGDANYQAIKGGKHVDFAGFNIGYKNNYAFGPVGFEVSATALKGFYSTELVTMGTIYKIQSALVIPLLDTFNVYGGVNVSHFGSAPGTTYSPAVGSDFGAKVDVGAIGMRFGFQTLGYSAQSSNSSVSDKSSGYISGISTEVAYTF
ncbi:MAG: hypothetical protein WA160_13385 [Pseudobdellovibrio sp.]